MPSLNPLQISTQDSANPEESSLDSFASHAATWAKQCLAFRSSKTWSPTRPCCRDTVYSQPTVGPQHQEPTRAVGSEMICLSNSDPFSPKMRTLLEQFGKRPKHDLSILYNHWISPAIHLHFGLGLLDEPSLKMFKALEQQRHGGVKAGRFHLEPSLPAATDECRPCCPANVFLGSANGTPSPPPADAPACVLRLTGHGLRCLQRFHEKQGLHSMTFQSQEGCCLLNFCTVCMV